MEMKLEIDNGVIILKLAGNLAADSVDDLKNQIAKLMEKNYLHILFDMSRVDLVDSTGLGACGSISRDLAAKTGILACVGLNENVQRVFQMTRFDKKITIFTTRHDGVNALMASIRAKNA